MEINSIKTAEIAEACRFIKIVFDEFTAEEYSSGGIGHFYEMISEHPVGKRLSSGSMINVARSEGRIAGLIEVSDKNHIYLLFVAKEFHKKGIARRLIEFSISSLLEDNPELRELTVSSTSSAVEFYERLGFRKLADMQFKNDIISFPMRLLL
jgi:GNAT superfamily N-acetyltransferase